MKIHSTHDVTWALPDGSGHIPALKVLRHESLRSFSEFCALQNVEIDEAFARDRGFDIVAGLTEVHCWVSPAADFVDFAFSLARELGRYLAPFLSVITDYEFGAVSAATLTLLHQFSLSKTN